MANTKSAGKRARQSAVRTLRNRRVLSRLRTLQKKGSSTSSADATHVRGLISEIDKAAKRGIIHKNTANRRKARLKKSLTQTAPAPAA